MTAPVGHLDTVLSSRGPTLRPLNCNGALNGRRRGISGRRRAGDLGARSAERRSCRAFLQTPAVWLKSKPRPVIADRLRCNSVAHREVPATDYRFAHAKAFRIWGQENCVHQSADIFFRPVAVYSRFRVVDLPMPSTALWPPVATLSAGDRLASTMTKTARPSSRSPCATTSCTKGRSPEEFTFSGVASTYPLKGAGRMVPGLPGRTDGRRRP